MIAAHIGLSNDGPRLTATNYWETEYARRGYLYLSINAGCFRLLLPNSAREHAEEMRGTEHVVISMLRPLQWRDGAYAAEWMAEDGSDEPWACHLSPGQIDRGPKREDELPTWTAHVYTSGPELALELPAHLRFVSQLPCMEPLAETIRRGARGNG